MAAAVASLICLAALLPGPRRAAHQAVEAVRPVAEVVSAAVTPAGDPLLNALQAAAVHFRSYCLPESFR